MQRTDTLAVEVQNGGKRGGAVARVSIGLPVYNGARYIRESIESILSQTFSDLELIVSDNASTDATGEIATEFAARDARVRYYRNERNMGAAYNFNRVIALSTGQYFKHASYDDLLAPTYIERCVEELDGCPECVLAYCRMTKIDEQGRMVEQVPAGMDVRDPTPPRRYVHFNRVMDPGCMCDPVFGLFRKSTLDRTQYIQPFMSSDVFLLLEMTLRGEIHEIPEYLFFERWHPGGSVLSNPTFESRATWFDPNNAGSLWNYLPRWRWLYEHVRAIWRTEMPVHEKLLCLGDLRRVVWVNRRGLVFNLVALTEHFTHPGREVGTTGKL